MTGVQLAMIVLPLMKLSKTEPSLTHPQGAARIWVTMLHTWAQWIKECFNLMGSTADATGEKVQ